MKLQIALVKLLFTIKPGPQQLSCSLLHMAGPLQAAAWPCSRGRPKRMQSPNWAWRELVCNIKQNATRTTLQIRRCT
jgi:hypothetical protein